MTPDAPDLPKQSKKGDFHLVEFSLTDKARDELQADLDAYFADPQWRISSEELSALDPSERKALQARRLEHLKGIVERRFPEDILTRIRSMVESEEIHPVIMHNLPKDKPEHYGKFARNGGASGLYLGKRERCYSEAIANGIYAVLEHSPTLNVMLTRDLEKHHQLSPDGGVIHTDYGAVGIFSTALNLEHAPTRFMDMRAVLQEMTPEEREGLHFDMLSQSTPTGETHQDFWNNASIDYKKSSPQARAALERLVEDHAIDVDIQPGTMLVFNNYRIMHQARLGSLEHIPFLDLTEDYVTRVLSTHFGGPSVAR